MTSDAVSPVEALGKKAALFHSLVLQRQQMANTAKTTAKTKTLIVPNPELKGRRSDV